MTALSPWLILLLPLASAVVIALFTLRSPVASARLSIGAAMLTFGLSFGLFLDDASGTAPTVSAVNWLNLSDGETTLAVDLGLRLDALSRLMLLVVTGVGSAIHVYSHGYMKGDPGVSRYFAGLSLFMFSMLGIVLANNFVMMFVFWELVGVSSYLLIGFWYERGAAADAAKKAFITNRIGDFGFLLGIILIWSTLGSVDFSQLEEGLRTHPAALGSLATLAGVLIFCGAVGKSAQFPLHVWLPDAMEGPTPVSALIHAATMVAAGVYMLCRVFFILAVPGSQALEVIAWTGGITALLAALMAVQQNDIKRILAYSTLSQLGYMVMAVGLSGSGGHPAPAMYHLTTHAFFKALLFLGAGSVIHALHHEQDIWKMGGLARRMPVTYWTFLIGTLALCGVPPFSGFFSKDAILAVAHHGNAALFLLAVLVAFLTAFYMFRLVLVAFTGPVRSQAPDHAHESPPVMTLPLIALAVPAAIAGFWGIDTAFARQFESGASTTSGWLDTLIYPFAHAPVAAAAGLIATLAGIGAAVALYRGKLQDPLPGLLGAFAGWMRDRFYFDEFYQAGFVRLQDGAAAAAGLVDRWIFAGIAVKGLSGTVELAGRFLRLLQTGNLQTYALVFVAGVALLLYFALAR
ncbi:MAG: NADH-quinone oxidoreductase subunit L [Limisphaerales bacterium]